MRPTNSSTLILLSPSVSNSKNILIIDAFSKLLPLSLVNITYSSSTERNPLLSVSASSKRAFSYEGCESDFTT